MLAYTDSAASIHPAPSLDSPSDNAMTALSRLALGPVNTAYYMAVFERFDSTGRTTTTWNWAACLATLNWMLFRQLWSAALVYVAAAEGLALLLFAVGRSFLQWPAGVELGVLGAFAVLAFAVPGLYGNAILYADIRKRVTRALAASRTLPEACVLLEKQASSRKRLRGIVLANGVLVAAAAVAYLVWKPSDTPPLSLEPAVTVAQATAASTASTASSASAPALASPAVVKPHEVPPDEFASPAIPATAASAPAAAAASVPASTPVAAAPSPTPAAAAINAPSTAKAPKPSEQASALALPSKKIAPPQPAASAAPAVSKTASAVPSTTARAPAAKAAPAAEPASRAASTEKTAASRASAPASTAAPPTVGTAPGHYINVGMFAEEANARKAQARLLNEGLPAFRQELKKGKSRRIRVRVGPYESRAQADAAAQAIRAMALEAVVFKQ